MAVVLYTYYTMVWIYGVHRHIGTKWLLKSHQNTWPCLRLGICNQIQPWGWNLCRRVILLRLAGTIQWQVVLLESSTQHRLDDLDRWAWILMCKDSLNCQLLSTFLRVSWYDGRVQWCWKYGSIIVKSLWSWFWPVRCWLCFQSQRMKVLSIQLTIYAMGSCSMVTSHWTPARCKIPGGRWQRVPWPGLQMHPKRRSQCL